MSRDAKDVDRRTFLGTTAAAAAAMFIKPALVHGTHANSAIRVGLLGCGGRGTEDAGNLVDTGGARVVALADLFQDQLDAAHAHFDQLQQAKGYAALDVPGAKRVIEIGKRAEGKRSLDVGFQIRDCPPFVELVRRIHAGALGDIVCAEAYYLTGYIDRPPWPNASPAERRLRYWVRDRVLSGDIIVEQNIHVIDICNWVLQAHPLKATATGGRQGRPAADGDCYGNYNVLLRYPNNVPVTFSSTQFAKGWWDVSERFFGTKGTALSPYSGPLGIWGDEPWQAPLALQSPGQPAAFSVTGNFTSNLESADPEKKKAFIESINSGKFHNQADKGAESALSGMMARTAAYTGREVTWDELMKSEEVWDARLNLDRLR